MRNIRLAAAVILGAFVLGCAGEHQPLEPEPGLDPLFDFTNGPAEPGQVVMRTEAELLFGGFDPARGLFSINGLGVANPATSAFCGGPGGFDIMSVQDVVLELGGNAETVRELILGRNNTQHIYDASEFFNALNTGGLCAAVQVPRLAQGNGGFVLTDNDVLISGPGANSFGWTAQGTLDDLVNGGQTHYTEVQRAIFLPDGTFKGFVVEDIHLSHIGN